MEKIGKHLNRPRKFQKFKFNVDSSSKNFSDAFQKSYMIINFIISIIGEKKNTKLNEK